MVGVDVWTGIGDAVGVSVAFADVGERGSTVYIFLQAVETKSIIVNVDNAKYRVGFLQFTNFTRHPL